MDRNMVFLVFGGIIVFAGIANIHGITTRTRKKIGADGKSKAYGKAPFIKSKTASYHLLVGLWLIFSNTAIILTVYGCKAIFVLGNKDLVSTTIALVISGGITLAGLGLHISRKRKETIYAKPLGYHDNIRLRTELSVFLTGWQTSVAVAAMSAVLILTGDLVISCGIFAIYALWLAIAVIGSSMSIKKLVGLYKRDKPDELINYYKSIAQQTSRQEIKAALTIKTVMAYGYYGQLDKAEKALSGYRWADAPINCRFYENAGKAILNYLKNVYHVDGFIHAQKSMDELRFAILNYNDSYFPQEKNTKDQQLEDILIVQNSLLQIGELLTHNYDSKLIDQLENNYKSLCKTHISISLMLAGCLAQIYGDIGIGDKKQLMEAYCKVTAPFCKTISL